MKKVLCFAALLGFINHAFAQNSNPWPVTGNVAIGTTSPASLLSIGGNPNVLTGQQTGIFYAPTAITDSYGALALQVISAATSNSTGTVYGLSSQAGTATNTFNQANAFAIMGAIAHRSSGTLQSSVALYGNTPAITNSGTIGNAYGVYIGTQKVANVTNGWGIYQKGADDMNYLAGRVGIGTTAPLEQLEVSNAATGAIRISSQKTGLLANDIIGKLNFYKTDVSTGGSGIASSIQSRSYDLGGAFDMDFITGSVSTPVTAMTLHYNGFVGIGTTTPTYPLDVFGDVNVGNVLHFANNKVTTFPATDTHPTIYSTSTDGTVYPFLGAGNLVLQSRTSRDIVFVGNIAPAVQMVIQGTTGNVGVGTASPGSKLHVKETNATPGFSNIIIENLGETGYEAGINFKAGRNSGSTISGRIYTVFDGGSSSANARLTLQSLVSGGDYDNTLTVRYGSVGIGTTAPPTGYKLAVNGNVIATAVTVKLLADWPDYVFKKDYQLPTLNQVKDYIDKNHHLPDMPSEKEVTVNGLNLGEMNKLLTKKVEELTLYLIEKDKEIQVLKDRMNKIEKMIVNKQEED
jgi:hypothetical protein